RFDERAEPAGELRQEEYETDDPSEVAAAVRRVLGDEEPDATSCFAHSLVAVDSDWNPLTQMLRRRYTLSRAAAGVLGGGPQRRPRHADTPPWNDAACSTAGAGCTGRDRAAVMVGPSGALRVLYETERPQPKPGLFLYLADTRRVVEGGALSDGGNLHD